MESLVAIFQLLCLGNLSGKHHTPQGGTDRKLCSFWSQQRLFVFPSQTLSPPTIKKPWGKLEELPNFVMQILKFLTTTQDSQKWKGRWDILPDGEFSSCNPAAFLGFWTTVWDLFDGQVPVKRTDAALYCLWQGGGEEGAVSWYAIQFCLLIQELSWNELWVRALIREGLRTTWKDELALLSLAAFLSHLTFDQVRVWSATWPHLPAWQSGLPHTPHWCWQGRGISGEKVCLVPLCARLLCLGHILSMARKCKRHPW